MPLIIGQNLVSVFDAEVKTQNLIFFFVAKNTQNFTYFDTLIPDNVTRILWNIDPNSSAKRVGDVEGMATPWLWIYNNCHFRTGAIRHDPDVD